MSEENVITDAESIIDFVFGDESEKDHHSRDEVRAELETPNQPPAPEVEDDAADFDPYGEKSESTFTDDSAEAPDNQKEDERSSEKAPVETDSAQKEEKTPEPEKNGVDYQQEIAKLNKRLHDTQKAFHESTERAAKLQKRLEEIETRKAGREEDEADDNWFSDSDDKEVDALKQELSEIRQENETLGNQQQEIQQQANLAAWHQAAASVRAEHADFDELVYEKLEPMLDESNGDARIRALYLQQKDRSPAGAYKFARSLPTILEMLDDPDGFQAKIASLKEEVKKDHTADTSRKVIGNDGLRAMNSADFAEEKAASYSGSLVDKIFG